MTEFNNISAPIHPRKLNNCRSVIRDLLAQKRLNVSELARRIHLPQPTIHRLLTGKTDDPKLSTLSLIADFFGLTLDQLIGDAPLIGFEKIKKAPSLTAPIISWSDAINIDDVFSILHNKNPDSWLNIDMEASQQSFGLISKKSMEPKIPFGTILIVDPHVTPIDGDLILVHYKGTEEATIRMLVLDGPKKELLSIFSNSQPEKLTDLVRIIGVVIQTRFSYR